MKNLIQFLKVFKTATEVLSGSKYPTISLVLLFRAEIVAALSDQPNDCAMVRSMKQCMRRALDHRLPITELIVVTALLDPDGPAPSRTACCLCIRHRRRQELYKPNEPTCAAFSFSARVV